MTDRPQPSRYVENKSMTKTKISRYAILFPIFASFLIFARTGTTIAEESKTLRVLSYNIHVAVGMDKKLDIERIARVIMAQKPDLVALQEVDRRTDRVKKMDQIEELIRLTGMNVVFGRTIDHMNGNYGIALMSRFPIKEYKMTPLPKQENEEDRGVLWATIELDEETTIRFICTHLCHIHENRRVRQAKKINALFTEDDIPTLLGGDLNAVPESETLKVLFERWKDSTDRAPTFPSDRPRVKIDYILYRPQERFKVVETKVVEDKTASDHFPVLTVFEMPFPSNQGRP